MTAGLTSPLTRPPLTGEQAKILAAQVRVLNEDFGPAGWNIWLSDDPAPVVYAVRGWPARGERGYEGRTEHAADARSMRELLAERAVAREPAGQSADAMLEAWADL